MPWNHWVTARLPPRAVRERGEMGKEYGKKNISIKRTHDGVCGKKELKAKTAIKTAIRTER
ncbi:MAG: hypothetical protein BWY28_00189 [bacterium ADurb.Bin236]|nr:MAG: hypothetical protein BWY28_00189 [bacterium ADurb.Bin236]